MAAWYSNKKYYDAKTGKAVPGREAEALDYINIINADVTRAAFAVRENIIVGYFCPKARTDPDSLRMNTPMERVKPVPPKAPKGLFP